MITNLSFTVHASLHPILKSIFFPSDQLATQGLSLTASSLLHIPRFAAVVPPSPADSRQHRPDVAKTGLGSSAAMTTALTAAVLQLLGLVQLPVRSAASNAIGTESNDTATNVSPIQSNPSPSSPSPSLDLVHRVAQLAHCLAQGKAGSGFDVAAAVFGSCNYRRVSPAIIQPCMVRGEVKPSPSALPADQCSAV